MTPLATLVAAGVGLASLPRILARARLSRAKHPSVQGHVRLAKRLARYLPAYSYDESHVFCADGAPAEVERRRRTAFARLADELRSSSRVARQTSADVASGLSDLQFTSRHRVPFPFSDYVRTHLPTETFVLASQGARITDVDGNVAYDLTGSYGVNVFGYELYKSCIDAAVARARELGPVLGPLHPLVVDTVRRLREISGLDEVSFHMSGTEAVMQAVRLARYHTRRSHVVQFCGAYHGWWDGVQPGVGNPRPVRDVYVLRDMDERTLSVLRTRHDIACVLVNPLQALHPNSGAPGDATLIASDRRAGADLTAYRTWLHELQRVCRARGIPLILDEVFMGFRLARRGAQEYFGVEADLVTYGKTLGGGLPVGVVCGRADLMRRFRPDRPSDICFARGTFNTHPYVLAAMHEFLRRLDEGDGVGAPPLATGYAANDGLWTRRFAALNQRLIQQELPVRVAHLSSVATVLYTTPCRYNWMLQFYLRAEGLLLSWVGTGRLIFSHDYTDAEFDEVCDRFVRAASAMRDGGWWAHGDALTNRSIRRHVLREALRARLENVTTSAHRGDENSFDSTDPTPRHSSSGAR